MIARTRDSDLERLISIDTSLRPLLASVSNVAKDAIKVVT